MKFDKWTLILAAVGAVGLASAARGEEAPSPLLTAVSSTTISGYVDTSMQWNPGGGANVPAYMFGGPGKADGFNLNVVQLSLDKPLGETEWAAGYHVDLWFGPDANTLNTAFGPWSAGDDTSTTTSDFAIRQAYVSLRTPLGNGLDWKIGVFDAPIGYESLASPNDPNYTRSYGFTIEPHTLTGLSANYRFSDYVSFLAGVADTKGPVINSRAWGQDGNDAGDIAWMGTLTLTAPESWGFLNGSTLYSGVVYGMDDNNASTYNYNDNSVSVYVGATVATPITGLRAGFAFDYLGLSDYQTGAPNNNDGNDWILGGYLSYQATEKLSLHLRSEYVNDQAYIFGPDRFNKIWEVTLTAQYDLWKNVVSRVEIRWDHANTDLYGGGTSGPPNDNEAWMLAANIIYKF